MCEFAVRAAESLLENNMTEASWGFRGAVGGQKGGGGVPPASPLPLLSPPEQEQLVNDIEKVCYMLPHGVIGQCKDFVDSYGKAVVIMLLEATDPRAICTMLRLCPRRGAARGVAAALEPATGSFCNVCQILITYFDNELLKNETLAELGDVLEKGCELLPAPLTGKVSWRGSPNHRLFSPFFLFFLWGSPQTCFAPAVRGAGGAVRAGGRAAPGADDGPRLCLHRECALLRATCPPPRCPLPFFPTQPFSPFSMQKIRACDSPLGSEPCAWGPGYWCASMATAIECDVSGVTVPPATHRAPPAPLHLPGALPAPSILPVSPRRPSSTAGVIYGTRSHLSSRARCGLGSAPNLPWTLSLGMRPQPQGMGHLRGAPAPSAFSSSTPGAWIFKSG